MTMKDVSTIKQNFDYFRVIVSEVKDCDRINLNLYDTCVKKATNALEEQARRDTNPPLTEEQIRGMVGKPIYVTDSEEKDNNGWYVLLYVDERGFGCIGISYFEWEYLKRGVSVFAHEPKRD